MSILQKQFEHPPVGPAKEKKVRATHVGRSIFDCRRFLKQNAFMSKLSPNFRDIEALMTKVAEAITHIEEEYPNWHLMSDGVSYRLGFLNGRLRGIEGEENLKELVARARKK